MLVVVSILVSLAMTAGAFVVWTKGREARRADYIRTYMFPPGLLEKFDKLQPQLGIKDRQYIARALRQFFLAHLKSGRKFVAMPSQVVDELWHEFILYTRNYDAFCQKAFGRYMHHTPAIVLSKAHRNSNEGLRRTWWYACIEENINPRKPTRLPLLFALDAKLKIANGFHYTPNCDKLRRNGIGDAYCGGDFSDSDFDGSTSGFDDSSSPNGSSSSDTSDSDCSGGCSGGCGGGGD